MTTTATVLKKRQEATNAVILAARKLPLEDLETVANRVWEEYKARRDDEEAERCQKPEYIRCASCDTMLRKDRAMRIEGVHFGPLCPVCAGKYVGKQLDELRADIEELQETIDELRRTGKELADLKERSDRLVDQARDVLKIVALEREFTKLSPSTQESVADAIESIAKEWRRRCGN